MRCLVMFVTAVCLLFLFKTLFRACLHGGGGPQVGEVTRLAVVKKWPVFTSKFTTPESRDDVTRRCCVVARVVDKTLTPQSMDYPNGLP